MLLSTEKPRCKLVSPLEGPAPGLGAQAAAAAGGRGGEGGLAGVGGTTLLDYQVWWWWVWAQVWTWWGGRVAVGEVVGNMSAEEAGTALLGYQVWAQGGRRLGRWWLCGGWW